MKRENQSNDYLANIVDPGVWAALEALGGNEEPSYPYIEADELPGVVDAYDALWAAMQTRGTEAGVELYSRRPVSGTQADLGSRVDDALAGRRPTEPVVVGRAPVVLTALGAPESPVVVMPSVIGKARAKHRLTAEQIKSALQGLYDPVAVFDSAEAAHAPEGSFVVMVDAMAAGKKPIALAVHVDHRVGKTTITNIASIHPRPASQIENWIEQRLLRYAGDRVGTWLSRLGLQLPRAVVQGRRKGNILHPEDVFNRDQNDPTILFNNTPADNRARHTVEFYHKIAGAVTMDGRDVRLIATVRQLPDRTFHYDISRDAGAGRSGTESGLRYLEDAKSALEGTRADINMDPASVIFKREDLRRDITARVNAKLERVGIGHKVKGIYRALRRRDPCAEADPPMET